MTRRSNPARRSRNQSQVSRWISITSGAHTASGRYHRLQALVAAEARAGFHSLLIYLPKPACRYLDAGRSVGQLRAIVSLCGNVRRDEEIALEDGQPRAIALAKFGN